MLDGPAGAAGQPLERSPGDDLEASQEDVRDQVAPGAVGVDREGPAEDAEALEADRGVRGGVAAAVPDQPRDRAPGQERDVRDHDLGGRSQVAGGAAVIACGIDRVHGHRAQGHEVEGVAAGGVRLGSEAAQGHGDAAADRGHAVAAEDHADDAPPRTETQIDVGRTVERQ